PRAASDTSELRNFELLASPLRPEHLPQYLPPAQLDWRDYGYFFLGVQTYLESNDTTQTRFPRCRAGATGSPARCHSQPDQHAHTAARRRAGLPADGCATRAVKSFRLGSAGSASILLTRMSTKLDSARR